MELASEALRLDDIAIDEVVASGTSEVELLVSILNLFTSDADVVQSLSCGGVTHHLLQKEKLPGVIVRHNHLMVSKSLTKRVGRHLNVEVEVFGEPFQNPVDGVPMDGLVLRATMVGLASEHIVTQTWRFWQVLQICDDGLLNCSVDGDVAVPLMLPSIASLLLKDWEASLEALAVFIDEMSEAELPEVAHSESKVDANDEEHIVTVTPIIQ